MFFISSERKASNDAFEYFVDSADRALRSPAVIAEIGGLADRLLEINASTFLPNRKNGRFVLPRKEIKSNNLPLVPLTDGEAGDAYKLIQPLQEVYIHSWPAARAVHSARYNLELADDLNAVFVEGPKGEANAPTLRGLRSDTIARAQVQIGRSDDAMYYLASRPVLMARTSLLAAGEVGSAAAIAHEEAHIDDMLEDGPIYSTLVYGAASELRSYHVSASIYASAGYNVPGCETSLWVDSMRRNELGHTAFPYTPNTNLVGQLATAGII